MHESATGEHRSTSEDIGYTPQRAMARAKQLREKASAAQITTSAMRCERSRLLREGGGEETSYRKLMEARQKAIAIWRVRVDGGAKGSGGERRNDIIQ